jgi:hypothetical protein
MAPHNCSYAGCIDLDSTSDVAGQATALQQHELHWHHQYVGDLPRLLVGSRALTCLDPTQV